MKQIIYRISDLQCVGVIDGGTTLEWQLEFNVIPNFGGINADYAVIETDLNNIELKLVDGVVTAVEKIIPVVVLQPTDAERIIALENAFMMMM